MRQKGTDVRTRIVRARGALVIGGAPALDPRRRPITYLAFVLVMTLGMPAVCYAKGEPPSWRWGDCE